jgi:hypothetical protein
MRPVGRPPFNDRWATIDAAEAASIALGRYCSACEIPLIPAGIGWDAATGERVTGPVNANVTWPNLLVLCRHCVQAAARLGPESWGTPLRPDRDRTFGLGAAAPFRYDLVPLETVGSDGGEAEVVERLVVVAEDTAAADTVRLFGLNDYQPFDAARSTLAAADRSQLAFSGAYRRQLREFDDGRMMLRTNAWHAAHRAGELYPELAAAGQQQAWARLLAGAMAGQGFWSVWASVLTSAVPDLPLLASVLAPAATVLLTAENGAPQPNIEAVRAFSATRTDWLRPHLAFISERS